MGKVFLMTTKKRPCKSEWDCMAALFGLIRLEFGLSISPKNNPTD